MPVTVNGNMLNPPANAELVVENTTAGQESARWYGTNGGTIDVNTRTQSFTLRPNALTPDRPAITNQEIGRNRLHVPADVSGFRGSVDIHPNPGLSDTNFYNGSTITATIGPLTYSWTFSELQGYGTTNTEISRDVTSGSVGTITLINGAYFRFFFRLSSDIAAGVGFNINPVFTVSRPFQAGVNTRSLLVANVIN